MKDIWLSSPVTQKIIFDSVKVDANEIEYKITPSGIAVHWEFLG